MEKIKSTTVGQAYAKQGKELGIAVNKTFMVPIEHIFAESGFNVRDLDQEHIQSIADAYESGKMLPAIVVDTTSTGFKIIDGHHRFEAAKIAGVSRLECKQFVGSESEKIAFMVSSSQGRNLKPVERAMAYSRMTNLGMTKDEICKAVCRSPSDYDNHMLLLTAGDDVVEAVKSGEVKASSVVSEIRKHGQDATPRIMDAVKKSRDQGKKVVINKFTSKHYKEVMEILCGLGNSATDLDGRLAELISLYAE